MIFRMLICLILGSFLSLFSNLVLANTISTTQSPAAVTENNPDNSASTASININTADSDALQTVKGLTNKRAQAIIEYRQAHGPFTTVDDLTKVKGINSSLVAKIQNKLTVH